jgi:gliding motility-associated lipoprotein GldD
VFIILLFTSCDEYTPKPKGYSRIERTPYESVKFERPEFSFLYPSDSKIEYLTPEAKSEIWFNIIYPEYRATVYCTYIPSEKKGIAKMLDDSHRLAYSHAVKADGISQSQFTDSLHHTYGLIYDIKGAVASPLQFYLTDHVSNYLRGSVYFDYVINPDSISPVIAFVRGDIVNMMKSLRWGNSDKKR